ncbi:hypothetical protein GO496_04630 [Acidovorax citrulli]|nr:hypothetical protein [Paracidovorax citrulli]
MALADITALLDDLARDQGLHPGARSPRARPWRLRGCSTAATIRARCPRT